jgi:hypothetical protein
LSFTPAGGRDPPGCPRRSGRSRQHNGRSRFARFAKKLVQVPKKEIDEKAEEWKRNRDHKR